MGCLILGYLIVQKNNNAISFSVFVIEHFLLIWLACLLCLLTCSLAIMLTLLFQIHFLMILSSNWAYLKDASKMQAYQDIKSKEEQELQDIQTRSKEQLNSYT